MRLEHYLPAMLKRIEGLNRDGAYRLRPLLMQSGAVVVIGERYFVVPEKLDAALLAGLPTVSTRAPIEPEPETPRPARK